MSVTDTNLLEKCCSKCGFTKDANLFISKRNICKECRNIKCKENYKLLILNSATQQTCNFCDNTKSLSLFIKNRKICIDCNNNKRRLKYKNDEEFRVGIIQKVTEFKQKKALEKNKFKEIEIGVGNIKCDYCKEIKSNERFRHNRLKCKDCEREDPISKIIRNVRSRILTSIKNKSKHTIEYLDCNCRDYLKWLLNNDIRYTYENYGNEWHIDHVIPLSKFDITNKEEQFLAFNWRNTMPLSCKENLVKGNKIIKTQIEQHYKKLLEYHLENKLDLPQVFIDLFAKHLDAGSPLEPI
jgi:hypothetical protein